MNFRLSNKQNCFIALSGILTYIICIIIAMALYAGGTLDNPNAPGYTFWFNTFSDTGRVVARNGSLNISAMIFFSIAYSAIAITLIPYYMEFNRLFKENNFERKCTKVGAMLGITSSIALIGVVFTPADLFYVPHMIFAILAYVAILFMGIAYTIVLYRSEKFSKFYGYVFIIFSIVFFVFLMMALSSLMLNIRALLTIGQKIGRISFLISFTILIIGTLRL